MHIEQLRFDEVFDVQPARGDFSFRSGGRPVYGVRLGKGCVPAAGSRYAVAFEQAGDWDTVLAWRELGTQVVRFREPGWALTLMFFMDFIWFVPFVGGAGLLFGGPGTALAMAGAFLLLVALGAAWGVRRGRRVARALRAVGEPPPGWGNTGASQGQAAM